MSKTKIDLDFDGDALSDEADLFGISKEDLAVPPQTSRIADEYLPPPVQRTHTLEDLPIPKDELQWVDLEAMIQLVLAILIAPNTDVEFTREFLIEYGRAKEANEILTSACRGTLSFELRDIEKAMKRRYNQEAAKAKIAKAAKRIQAIQHEKQIEIYHCTLMLLKLITYHENWPGANRDWLTWFNRFNKYYERTKG